MPMYTGRFISNETIEFIREHFPPELDNGTMLEIYSDPSKFDPYQREITRQFRLLKPDNFSVYKECAVPIFKAYRKNYWLVLSLCMMMRLLAMSKLPRPLINLSFVVFYAYHEWYNFDYVQFYVIVPAILFVTYILLFNKRANGLLLSIVAALYILYCEYFMNPYKWLNVKGNCMVMFMRIISACFEVHKMEISALGLLGYAFNPLSTTNGGAFIPYKVHQRILNGHPLSLSWIYGCIKVLLLACIFTFFYECGIENYVSRLPTLMPFLFDRVWFNVYVDSLGFRTTHYSDCYISEILLLIAGIGTLVSPGENQSKESTTQKPHDNEQKIEANGKFEDTTVWSYPNVDPLTVEWPRSMADLMPAWNLTVHHFLKPCFFEPTKKYGLFVSIITTYIASVMLHAGNFQFFATLMAAGIYAYIEGAYRSLFAEYFSACVKVRKCRENCTHRYKKENMLVTCTNLIFTIMSIGLFSYATCVFDASPEKYHGYSMRHTLKKWQDLGFLCHIFLLTMYIAYPLFSTLLKAPKKID